MKNLTIFLALVIFASCANKVSLQKRRYSKGFYFAVNKTNKTTTKNSTNYLVKHHAVSNTVREEAQITQTVESIVINNEKPNIVFEQNSPQSNYTTEFKKVVKKGFISNTKQNIQKRTNYNKCHSFYLKKANFLQGMLAVIVAIIGVYSLVFGIIFLLTSGSGLGISLVLFFVSFSCFYLSHNLGQ